MVRTNFPVWLALLAVGLMLAMVGCGSSTKPDPQPTQPAAQAEPERLTTLASRTLPAEDYFNAALSHMENAERAEFLNLRSDSERRRYLTTHGIDCKVDMDMALEPGLTLPQIQSVFTTNDHLWQDETTQVGGTTWYYFKRFSGDGYTHMYCIMRPETEEGSDLTLVSWGSYPEGQSQENLQIGARASDIDAALGRIIEVGMAMQSIPVLIETRTRDFAQLLNGLASQEAPMGQESPAAETLRIQYEESIRHFGLLGDRVNPLAPPDRTPTLRERDAYWENQWRERTTNAEEFYAMNFREPDESETVGQLTRWMYYLPHGSQYLCYTIQFKNQRVESWWTVPVSTHDVPASLLEADAN